MKHNSNITKYLFLKYNFLFSLPPLVSSHSSSSERLDVRQASPEPGEEAHASPGLTWPPLASPGLPWPPRHLRTRLANSLKPAPWPPACRVCKVVSWVRQVLKELRQDLGLKGKWVPWIWHPCQGGNLKIYLLQNIFKRISLKPWKSVTSNCKDKPLFQNS